MERTISGMMGKGSVNHNTRAFSAKNVDKERSRDNVEFCHKDIKAVYHELFDEALERYNAKQKRSDRKIENYYEKIRQGKQEKLYLGNLSSLRDWGYAKDYVECMWLILQNGRPDDYVIATGVQHSVREFCQLAFREAGIELEFAGEGAEEKGIDKATGRVLVEVSPDFYRPTDVVNLWGDPTKAKATLGWNPTRTSFEELVRIMVEHDMRKVAADCAAEDVRKMNLVEYLEKGIVK